MTIGVYVPGASALHRASPGVKLIGLAAFAVCLSLTTNLALLAALAVGLLLVWGSADLGWQRLISSLTLLKWILVVMFVFQFLSGGLLAATELMLTICALVSAAALVSFTTRTDDMLETLQYAFSAFARFGLNPNTVAFALVFVIRLVPFVATVGREAIEARLARGGGRNPIPALVPMVIRLMRETDTLSEALVARGFARS